VRVNVETWLLLLGLWPSLMILYSRVQTYCTLAHCAAARPSTVPGLNLHSAIAVREASSIVA
jgi:hypothetical protein